MSRRRWISTDIKKDKKIVRLSKHGALPLLLYTWAIPHMDDWGRISGEPIEFKMEVCPALDVSLEEIDQALTQIADAGLWARYELRGDQFIAIPSKQWFENQSYINANKRYDDKGSDFPTPPNWEPIYPDPEKQQKKNNKSNENSKEQQETAKEDSADTEKQQETARNSNGEQGSAEISITPSPSPTLSPSPTPSKHIVVIEDGKEVAFTAEELENPYDAIEKLMQIRMVKANYICRSDEYQEAKRLLESGIPIEFILDGISFAFNNYRAKNTRDRINSFTYCVPIIEKTWEAQQSKQEAAATTHLVAQGSQTRTARTNNRDERYAAFYQLFPDA